MAAGFRTVIAKLSTGRVREQPRGSLPERDESTQQRSRDRAKAFILFYLPGAATRPAPPSSVLGEDWSLAVRKRRAEECDSAQRTKGLRPPHVRVRVLVDAAAECSLSRALRHLCPTTSGQTFNGRWQMKTSLRAIRYLEQDRNGFISRWGYARQRQKASVVD